MMKPMTLFAAALALLLLAGCTAAPVPATTWLRLPADAAVASPPAPTAPSALPSATTEVWQWMSPVVLPAHLDRDTLFVPQGGGAAMLPLAGVRWIEPLHEALPRLLREDLARAAGTPLWRAPLPPGLVATRQLRIELAAFEIAADGRVLATQARWSIADARGNTPPRLHEARFDTAATGSRAEAWAAAHRQAITTLATRIAATMAAGS
jgi:uncharacterized protein